MEYAKRGTAGCKKCKDKIPKEVVRIGKIVPNPFSESAGEMKEWYHVKCIFEKLERARATTKKIEDITDLEGWEELQDQDKEVINKHVSGAVPRCLMLLMGSKAVTLVHPEHAFIFNVDSRRLQQSLVPVFHPLSTLMEYSSSPGDVIDAPSRSAFNRPDQRAAASRYDLISAHDIDL